VSVEVGPCAVVAAWWSGVGVLRRDLDVSEVDACVESDARHSSHDLAGWTQAALYGTGM
jgi:hypothetical protein